MSWTKKKIGEVCSLEKGATGITKAISGNYPMVTLAAERTSHNEYQFDAKAVIIPLISSTGHGHASMKRIHYQEGKFALGSILCAAIPKDEQELNAKFLFHYLDFYKEKLFVPLMRGAANVSLSMKSIVAVEIPIPPICEQEQIVEKIINTEKEFDLLNSELTHQQRLLTQLRQAILQEAVQGKLVPQHPDDEPASVLLDCIRAEKAKLLQAGKLRKEKPLPPIRPEEMLFALPEGWVWCRLGDVVSQIFDGPFGSHLKTADYTTSGVRVLRLENLGEMEFKKEKKTFISKSKYAEIKQHTVYEGDIIIGSFLADGVKCIVLPRLEETTIAKADCFCIRINHSLLCKEYIMFLLSSNPMFKELSGLLRGMTRLRINTSQLKNLPIPLPPLAEQRRMVARVQQLLGWCAQLEQQVQESRGYAGQLLQAVLQEAFGRG